MNEYKLSDSQIKYGFKILEQCADRWNITKDRAAEFLTDISFIQEKWNWINMDEFLNIYLDNIYEYEVKFGYIKGDK